MSAEPSWASAGAISIEIRRGRAEILAALRCGAASMPDVLLGDDEVPAVLADLPTHKLVFNLRSMGHAKLTEINAKAIRGVWIDGVFVSLNLFRPLGGLTRRQREFLCWLCEPKTGRATLASLRR